MDGKTLFHRECVLCHGADGMLEKGGAMPLPNSIISRDSIVSLLQTGRNDMPIFDYLKQDELSAITDYVIKLREN